MIGYIVISTTVAGVTRAYISKKDISHKNLVSLLAGYSITGVLEIIQLILGGILCLFI